MGPVYVFVHPTKSALTFFALYDYPRTLKSQPKLSTKKWSAPPWPSIKNADDKSGPSLWIFGEILHAISCLTALICLAYLFWVMFRIKVWARKWALKRDKIYKKYIQPSPRQREEREREISSWQSNKSVKITHLLSWHPEPQYFLCVSLLWSSDMWSIKTSSFTFQVMERTLQTMGLHPTYLEAFKATHDKILSEEAPISALDRHHLALMVSQKLLSMHPWLLNVAAYLIQRRCNTNENGIKLQKCSCSAIIGNFSKQYLILQFRSSWRVKIRGFFSFMSRLIKREEIFVCFSSHIRCRLWRLRLTKCHIHPLHFYPPALFLML